MPQVMTEEERTALEKVKNSCTIVGERYQVGVPWKRDQPSLPDNHSIALSRLVSTEKSLKKDTIVAEEYSRTLKEYVEKGYLRKIDPNQEKAAVLGLRLPQSIHKVMCLPIQEANFFSDSEDVLWWVRGRGRDFRSFVANRVGEIQSNTSPSQWQHVSTAENPADACTRGASPVQLAKDMMWWEGPEWLKQSSENWPKMKLESKPRSLSEQKPLKEPIASTSLATDVTGNSESTTEPVEWISYSVKYLNDIGSTRAGKRFANGRSSAIIASDDGTSLLVKSWHHSRRQGCVLPIERSTNVASIMRAHL